MKKILTLSGSNSKVSINRKLLDFIETKFNSDTNLISKIDLLEFDFPMYSIDIETETGIPEEIQNLNTAIQKADALIISVAEHNGNLTAYFKNILDWLSRNDRNFLEGKNIFILSTSPGGNGGSSALNVLEKTLPYFKGNVVAKQSIGSFYELYKNEAINGSSIESIISDNISKL